MTLLDYLNTLRRYALLIFALVVLCGGGAYLLSTTRPDVYQASATVLVSADRAGSASDLVQGSTYVEQLVSSYAVMVRSEVVLQPVIDELGLDTTPKALAGSLTAETPVNTVLIDIHARRWDPAEARILADAVADQLAVAVSKVSPSIDDEPAVRVTTIQSATLPRFAIAPSPRRWAVGGGLVGLLLGIGLALLLRVFGGRVRDASDVASVASTPTLGEVVEAPRRLTLPAAVLRAPRSAESESLRRVAANMHYLGVDGGMRSFLVTSASPGEGKSSIAAAMALILAETSDRVLLVDADLRSPSLHALTGLEPDVGLSTVLVGDIELDQAIQSWGTAGPHVLTSGPVPPNPGQLVNSDAMKAVLVRAREQYDTVVVDTGPMMMVSDPVWLGHLVEGVLVVARRGHTRTILLGKILNALATARVPASGVVISRGKRPRRGEYGYPVAK